MAEELDRESFRRDWHTDWSADPPLYGWATKTLIVLTDDSPELAWSLILGLFEVAADVEALSCIAAGPLEDLLCHHGVDFIDRVEVLAAVDDRFRRCLSGVWGSNRMDPAVNARMCRAAPGKRAP